MAKNHFIPVEAQLKKLGFNFIAGIDEAGRGPLAGPVVSAAVILKNYSRIPGLKDSKLLSQAKREELFPIVLKNCIDYSITIIPESKIDEVNILNATRQANQICIDSLEQIPCLIIVDGHNKQFFDQEYLNFIKGDKYIKSIAAASILAKVVRDKLMEFYDKLYPQYGFKNHKGYGTREHRSNIKKYGYCEIHRTTFKLKK